MRLDLNHEASPLLAELSHIRHAFFSRQGGVSTGAFKSLNTAYGSGDLDEAVTENRRRIAAFLELTEPTQLVSLKQIHSRKVMTIDHPFSPGESPQGDGLVTTTPGIALGVMGADCPSILFADRQNKVIGAAHAGWKGALGGVIEETIAAMIKKGACVSRMVAAIGPCIWPESYEVGEDFRKAFLEVDLEAKYFYPGRDSQHWQFDLPGYVSYRLKKNGITQISSSPADTYSQSHRFFSNRRRTLLGEEKYGCMLACIMIK